MSDKIFRIDFYPKDWLIDTAQLSPEERGLYIQIVMLIYAKEGPIDNDPQWIAGVSGCSTRMAKSLVGKLVEKGFLSINSDGKIGQKRAENELKSKRTHLELSAKGGRKSAEKRAENNNNNDISPTDEQNSVGTTTPPHPTPSLSKIIKHPDSNPHASENPEPSGGGVFKNGKGGSGGKFKIDHHLTDDEREDAKRLAPGWDMQVLYRTYDEGVVHRGVPKHPGKAFLAWVPKYTKGKPP